MRSWELKGKQKRLQTTNHRPPQAAPGRQTSLIEFHHRNTSQSVVVFSHIAGTHTKNIFRKKSLEEGFVGGIISLIL